VVVRLRWPRHCRPRLTAERAGPLQAAPCSRSPAKCCVQVLERIKGGGAPGGGIMEVVAWQPKVLGRAFVAYAAACLEIVLLGTPKPPSSCDSCRRISTQARSCRFHVHPGCPSSGAHWRSYGRRAVVGAPAGVCVYFWFASWTLPTD
jgi:hypothetical protein